jgi:large subunit ribosomal protein L15
LKSGAPGLLEAAAAAYRAASQGAGAETAVAEPVDVDVLEVATGKYRLPDPTKRRDIEYYRDPAHRGYLSHLLKGSEGPSLFFRSSEERKSAAGVTKKKVLPENRLW